MTPLPPASTIGIIGGGQLGLMLTEAAHQLGYRVAAFTDTAECPIAALADELLVAPYEDPAAIARFARLAAAATVETETLPADALAEVSHRMELIPPASLLLTTQDRAKQRTLTARLGIAVPPHRVVASPADLEAAGRDLALPVVIKRATGGYDGRGQQWVHNPADLLTAWESLGAGVCVVEERVDFAAEFSIIVCRDRAGALAFFEPIRNLHRDGILRVSSAPADIPPESAAVAREFAARFAVGAGLVGIACLECYLLPGGAVLVNEVAARPHNSGHLTIEACRTSQFAQLIRIVAGHPPGPTDLLQPATMLNLVGAIDEAALAALEAAHPGRTFVHRYGKSPRPGRKLGHVTVLGSNAVAPPSARPGCEIG
jgi:5-(carboxyamino)imidazole ribonucleotide synthase